MSVDAPPPTVKRCLRCGEEKPLGDFDSHARHRDGLQSYCRPCAKDLGAAWSREIGADRRLARQPAPQPRPRGVYATWWKRQNGRCAICGQAETIRDAHGVVLQLSPYYTNRYQGVGGLLCKMCSVGLSFFRDDIAVLARAITFLSQSLGASDTPMTTQEVRGHSDTVLPTV